MVFCTRTCVATHAFGRSGTVRTLIEKTEEREFHMGNLVLYSVMQDCLGSCKVPSYLIDAVMRNTSGNTAHQNMNGRHGRGADVQRQAPRDCLDSSMLKARKEDIPEVGPLSERALNGH